jgi:hypothetical protein
MSTPTPQTDSEEYPEGEGQSFHVVSADFARTLERELAELISVNATGAARLAHATAQLAAEREKVRVLREALDEAQSCGGLTGSIFMQARAALAATEETP